MDRYTRAQAPCNPPCAPASPKPEAGKMSSQAVYLSMSLLGLTSLVGAGVAVGSGVAMMSMQMGQEAAAPVAHSVVEKRAPAAGPARGFAAGQQ
mmetsp:Transcript_982/g.3172  ORF Transcript_982/g.3172 Transcript_982/m.3172 type:complete len:94 (+) Transcript_982:2-283(+)